MRSILATLSAAVGITAKEPDATTELVSEPSLPAVSERVTTVQDQESSEDAVAEHIERRLRAAVIIRQHEMLRDRVEYFRSVYDVVRQDDMSRLPVDDIWPTINRFETQLGEIIHRLETMTLRSFELHPRTEFGWFEKRLRRLRYEQQKLARLSKIVCYSPASARRVSLLQAFSDCEGISAWDVRFSWAARGKKNNSTAHGVEAFMREMRLAGSLGDATVDTLNHLFELNVPAILDAQACVYAAAVADITRLLQSFVQEVQSKK